MNQAKQKIKNRKSNLISTGTLLALTLGVSAYAQSNNSDPIVDALIEKGVLNQQEAAKIEAEIATRQSNYVNQISQMPASKWKISDSIKNIQLFGDFRLRYEYRGVDNLPGSAEDTYYQERFRYALRVGVRGDLFDNFNYGIRLETSTNPRSPWDTFGKNTTPGAVTPSDKSQSGINVGQAFLGWHPGNWVEMTFGRMPMPLYTTPMVWDSDINPEGAFEKFKLSRDNVNWFADFGQFMYQDVQPGDTIPSSAVFLLTWQMGAIVKLPKEMSFEIAPMFYTYTGVSGGGNGLNQPFVGQGNSSGANIGLPGSPGADLSPGATDFNQDGINDLLVLEVPMEFQFKIPHSPLGKLQARFFGDFACNFKGDSRANAAYNANPSAFPGLNGPVDGQNKAYQIGFGIGSDGPVYGPTQGLVYGSTSKKNTWEARVYWQHVEQYALDVNLMDSDFFEGRANLEGIYSAFAYSFTDAIIGTIRYGYANRINGNLGTGGNNLDTPGINPIKNYNLLQMDLTWRF